MKRGILLAVSRIYIKMAQSFTSYAVKFTGNRSKQVSALVRAAEAYSIPALACRVTSYNFNIHGIVNAALRHIMEFAPRPKRNAPNYVEVEGLIVERETTGRAVD